MRMPVIGDHVWREGARPPLAFDGYVHASEGAFTTIVPKTVAEYVIPEGRPATVENLTSQEVHGVKALDGIRVATLFLVRQLHGWRWAPWEMRPEVKPGDVIVWPYEDGVVRVLVVCEASYGWRGRNMAVGIDAEVSYLQAAKALAGIEGWSWEPARWPGEPGGGA